MFQDTLTENRNGLLAERPSRARLVWLLIILAVVAIGGLTFTFLQYRALHQPAQQQTAVSTKPTPAEIQAALTKLASTTASKPTPAEIKKQLDALAKKSPNKSAEPRPTPVEIQAALGALAK